MTTFIVKHNPKLFLPGARAEPIVSQAHGEWDFDLRIGESIFAVEVTQSTGQRTEGLYAAIFGKDGENTSVRRVLARDSWIVSVSHLSNVREVSRRVDGLLAELEKEGRMRFSVAMRACGMPSRAVALPSEVTLFGSRAALKISATFSGALIPREAGKIMAC